MWLNACAAQRSTPSDDRREAALAFGLPPEQVDQLLQPQDDAGDEPAPLHPIWPDTWLPLQLFIAMDTQWTDRGLRLEAVPLASRSAGMSHRARRKATSPQTLADLRVMEVEALVWRDEQTELANRRALTLKH